VTLETYCFDVKNRTTPLMLRIYFMVFYCKYNTACLLFPYVAIILLSDIFLLMFHTLTECVIKILLWSLMKAHMIIHASFPEKTIFQPIIF
jgi:hypothetical protein